MKVLALGVLLLAAGPRSGAANTTAIRPASSGPARAGVQPPPTQVDAYSIEYDYKGHRTVMTGKPLVTFKREDAVLVCRKMVADHFQGGDIQRAVCEGDVKLTRGERIVTCNRATYTAADNRVVCRGDPILHDGPSIMHCDEVIYDLEQDRVFVKQGKGTIYQKPGQTLPGKKKEKASAPP